MTAWDTARILTQLARWGVSWLGRDTRYPSPVPENAKFLSPRDAAKLLRDGDVVAASGLGGHQRASIIYWAIREVFEETGHPVGLTVMNLGGHGGRGMVPGTLEELGQAGLCTRLITGHFETFRAMLDLADKGQCELQCVPLGVMARLFDALGNGRSSWLSDVGVGTFIDPRVGPGSPVADTTDEQLVRVAGDRLRYHIPKIDVAVFNAPAADRQGNLYAKHSAMLGDSYEIARAAKRNGGRVIANVGLIVDEGYGHVFLPAEMVDAVVYYPDTEQTVGYFHREPWLALTPESDAPIGVGLEHIRLVNWLAGATPRRTAADDVLARLAAATLFENICTGALVNIGVGLPEEVCRVIFDAGRLDDVTFFSESGVVGGLPAAGVYFGAALSPRDIVSTAEIFKRCSERLDAACLGALEIDSDGNVNVSMRGEGAGNYVGPGGFLDLTAAADTIIFVSAWMARAEIVVEDAKMRILRPGIPKFVEQVKEVTFSGQRALAAGKRVFYATHVGLFQLTKRGVELVRVMPGIDIPRDILAATSMHIVLPPSGRVALVPASIVTGRHLSLQTAPAPKRRAARRAAPAYSSPPRSRRHRRSRSTASEASAFRLPRTMPA